MATLGTLKTRIADELNRTDLTSQIALAITSAIDFYEADTPYFQEQRSSFPTVDGQEYYGIPTGTITIRQIRATINSTNNYLLDERDNEYMEDHYDPAAVYKGYPQDWTIEDQQIRIGPIPNDAYTLTVFYVKALDALSGDSDENDWIKKLGEQLVRARAKWDLYLNVIKDQNEATSMRAQEIETLKQLRRRTLLYSGTVMRKYL